VESSDNMSAAKRKKESRLRLSPNAWSSPDKRGNRPFEFSGYPAQSEPERILVNHAEISAGQSDILYIDNQC